jgi:hypothetical protein
MAEASHEKGMSEQQAVFNSLVNQRPAAWLAYIHSYEDGESVSTLSMEVIFHHATQLAERHESLEWAEVAVRVAELDARRSKGAVNENCRQRAMGVRARFIAKMGSRPNHYILDKEILVRWVMESLKGLVQKAKLDAAAIREKLPPSDGAASRREEFGA